MKKILTFLLVAMMLLSLAACGGKLEENGFIDKYTYYEDGKVKTEKIYDENGEFVIWFEYTYYENGNIKVISELNEAGEKEESKEFVYDDNGRIHSMKRHVYSRAETEVAEYSYYDSGTIRSCMVSLINGDSTLLDSRYDCYESGIVKCLTAYHENGNVAAKFEYVEDENYKGLIAQAQEHEAVIGPYYRNVFGCWEQIGLSNCKEHVYYEDGTLSSFTLFDAEESYYEREAYDESGHLTDRWQEGVHRYSATYYEGILRDEEEYDETGKLIREYQFFEDPENGGTTRVSVYAYYESGTLQNLTITETFENSSEVYEQVETYYENGQKKTYDAYIDGHQIGHQHREWDESGNEITQAP